MTSGDAVASTSAVSLDALLEESHEQGEAEQSYAGAEGEETEPIPTLASLLLSTAESLASRSTSASLSKPPPTKPSQPTFTLASSPRTLFNNTATPAYLSSLISQPLSALQSLPTSLSQLSTTLDNDLSSLAFTRYSSFLLSYTAAQSISTSFTTLSDSLAALLDSTSALEAAASSFETRVHTVREKRERFARVWERIEEVEELLEAPGVVDACVRAGYWSEAIDVAVRLEELHKRLVASASYGNEEEGKGALSLLNRVRDEVGVALLSLRARVLESLLQRSLKLPGAVRGIAILRRIAERASGTQKRELDEEGLRLVFLTARWRCLRTELETVEAHMAASGVQLLAGPTAVQYGDTTVEENEERTRWTKRWIDAWREIVGETVGMYTEVFLSSSSLQQAVPPVSDTGASSFSHAEYAPSPSAPLQLFLSQALQSLSTLLTAALPALNSTSSLSSLLTQLTYCSHSFSRHGLDFREILQLRERVELRLGRIVAGEFEAAGRKWEREWRSGWENSGGTGTTAQKARRSGRVPIADWLVMPEGLSALLSTPLPPSPSYSSSTSTPWSHLPSPSLALLPPLARFLNAHASALNALRLLPPISLYRPLRRAQSAELDRATQVLAAFTDAWLAALNATPLLQQTGFATSPVLGRGGGRGGEGGDALSEDEKLLLSERQDERRVVAAAIAWFGRGVVPWCSGALGKGVYAELGEREGERKEREEESVRDAKRRCEQLVARIEGREWVDEEAAEEKEQEEQKVKEETEATSEATNGGINGASHAATEEATEPDAPQEPSTLVPPPTELPVLDLEASSSLHPSSDVSPTSPTTSLDPTPSAAVAAVVENGLPTATTLDSDSLLTASAAVPPVDFALSPVAADVELARLSEESEKKEDADAPYLVGDVAPPPPQPLPVEEEVKEVEGAVEVVEEEETDDGGWGLGEVLEEENDEGREA